MRIPQTVPLPPEAGAAVPPHGSGEPGGKADGSSRKQHGHHCAIIIAVVAVVVVALAATGGFLWWRHVQNQNELDQAASLCKTSKTKADKAFSVVVMFDPRPGVVHAYAAAHDGQEPGDGFRDSMALTSVDQRLRTLENLGVDHVLIVRYTLAFATKSYRFFLGQMVGNIF